ncbi:MAG: IS1182 family transposase [Caldilineaceae bacterium]|jgi:transposase
MLDPERQSNDIPEDTARLARRIFRKKNSKGYRYLLLRDRLGVIFEDEAFVELFSTQGKPALSPGMLVMVQVLAFCEGLSDRQAVDAVASRIDWKYVLGLPLAYEGFDASVLTEFRARLVESDEMETLLLERLLAVCQEEGLVKERGRQRTDSTHVLTAARALRRLELVVETMSHTLEVLATAAPQWVQNHLNPLWYDRYGQELDGWPWPKKDREKETLALVVGGDGFELLDALYREAQSGQAGTARPNAALYQLEAVQTLRQIWVQQYYREDKQVQWRTLEDSPSPQQRLKSPYDVDARWASKGDESWIGYKVHITETCDCDGPHLLTDIQTRPSGEADGEALPSIQENLAQRKLLPSEQLVDAGYLTSRMSLRSEQTYDVTLVGQIQGNTSWQARTSPAYAAANFTIDWERRRAICPQGKESSYWSREELRRRYDVVRVRFDEKDCQACPVKEQCTKGKARNLQLSRQEEQQTRLQALRQRQREPDFWDIYKSRAGIEGSISFGIRTLGLRRTRYFGMAKTHLQHVFIAIAGNLLRLSHWFAGTKRSRTRKSKLLALKPALCT